MANDPNTEAIAHGVVSALGAAGLLQQGAGGLLLQPPAPLPQPPQPAHAVGDIFAPKDPFESIGKSVSTQPNQLTIFSLYFGGTATTDGDSYELYFPPNDPIYLPELDRLLSAFGNTTNVAWSSNVGLRMGVSLQITEVMEAHSYHATLRELDVAWSTP